MTKKIEEIEETPQTPEINETPVVTEPVVSKLQSLLTKSAGKRGQVIATEDELFKMFSEAECGSKTDMIMLLHDADHPHNDIAKTLAEHGILGKSAYQMVRNTVDRVTNQRAAAEKKSA